MIHWRVNGRYVWALVIAVLLAGPAAAQSQDLLIRGGTVVNADGQAERDVRVRDGAIVEVGENLETASSEREIDATGLLVLPGGIDPHVHLFESGADDYTSGSAAALAGGITTISNFISPRDGEGLLDALTREAARARTEAIADVLLHPIIGDPSPIPDELPAMVEAGHTSLKVFMVRGAFDRTVPEFLTALDAVGDAGPAC